MLNRVRKEYKGVVYVNEAFLPVAKCKGAD